MITEKRNLKLHTQNLFLFNFSWIYCFFILFNIFFCYYYLFIKKKIKNKKRFSVYIKVLTLRSVPSKISVPLPQTENTQPKHILHAFL